MKISTGIAVVIAVLAALGGWYYYNGSILSTIFNTSATTSETPAELGMPVPGTDTPEMEVIENSPMSATITYGAGGFSPKTVTVAKGGVVTFVSENGAKMWVGADKHPTHKEYDGTSRAEHCAPGATLSFDQCGTGNSYSFTFDKAGSFNYHNHVQASDLGTVIVTE